MLTTENNIIKAFIVSVYSLLFTKSENANMMSWVSHLLSECVVFLRKKTLYVVTVYKNG